MEAGVALRVCAGAVLAVVALGLPRAGAAQPPASPGAEDSAVKARTHLVLGELLRVDSRRHVMAVKTADRPPREIEITVEPGTRLTDRGRAATLDGIRPGARLSVTCVDSGGLHVARVVAVRSAGPPAAPPPSPRP